MPRRNANIYVEQHEYTWNDIVVARQRGRERSQVRVPCELFFTNPRCSRCDCSLRKSLSVDYRLDWKSVEDTWTFIAVSLQTSDSNARGGSRGTASNRVTRRARDSVRRWPATMPSNMADTAGSANKVDEWHDYHVVFFCHLLQESDNLWWDAFATEFFEDDATLTLTFCLEDGPKRYSKYQCIFSFLKVLYRGFNFFLFVCRWHWLIVKLYLFFFFFVIHYLPLSSYSSFWTFN